MYNKITVQGTERLLKGLQQFQVEQFIFSSTMLVHKPQNPGTKITEDSPLTTAWGYPKSKVETEEMIHKLRGDIPAVILRIAGVYDDRCHSIPLSNQIQRIYENQLEGHVFAGDVSHGASFVHMDDLVDAIDLCVQKKKNPACRIDYADWGTYHFKLRSTSAENFISALWQRVENMERSKAYRKNRRLDYGSSSLHETLIY